MAIMSHESGGKSMGKTAGMEKPVSFGEFVTSQDFMGLDKGFVIDHILPDSDLSDALTHSAMSSGKSQNDGGTFVS